MRRVATLLGIAAVAAVQGQTWQVLDLNPPGNTHSGLGAMYGNFQVGGVTLPGNVPHAGIWNGTPESFRDVNPIGASMSISWAASPRGMVGTAWFKGQARAGIWNWHTGAWTDLNPRGALHSDAYAAAPGMQAGGVLFIENVTHAAIWRGSPHSFRDLHPTGLPEVENSRIEGTDGFQQVGFGAVRRSPSVVNYHAMLWSGTAASYVDLHPTSLGDVDSIAFGGAGGVQVGWVHGHEAALWRGSAATYVNMNPPGAFSSSLRATDGVHHVGTYSMNDYGRAGIWMDSTPQSVVNLHSYLGVGYKSSFGHGIFNDERGIWVLGTAFTSQNNSHAVMWHLPMPERAVFLRSELRFCPF